MPGLFIVQANNRRGVKKAKGITEECWGFCFFLNQVACCDLIRTRPLM
jgi:hypothetical protein